MSIFSEFLTALLTASFGMSAVILLLLFLNKLLADKVSATLRYYMWLIVLVGLLIPFRPAVPVPFEPIQIFALFETSDTSAVTGERAQTGAKRLSSYESIPSAEKPSVSYTLIVFGAWLIGMLSVLAFHLRSYCKFSSSVRRWGVKTTEGRILSIIRSVQAHLGLQGREIAVKTCVFVSSPMLIGFFSPTILLPEKAISADELAYIFRHELTHYKRGDLWINLLLLSAYSMHWFNPFVYLMAKAVRADCEVSCDAMVVAGSDSDRRRQYGETVIGFVGTKFAETKSVRSPILSTYFYGGGNDMKKRLFSIMDMGAKSKFWAAFCLTVVIFMTLLYGSAFAAPYGAWQSGIGEAEAGQKALSLIGSGSIVLSESKYKKDGRIEYKVTIADGEAIHKVDFYGDGTLKKMTRENVISGGFNASAYGNNVIGDARAIEIARERTGGGTVTKCKLDYKKKEGLRYEVKIIQGGGEHKVKINASTGAVYDYSFKTKGLYFNRQL